MIPCRIGRLDRDEQLRRSDSFYEQVDRRRWVRFFSNDPVLGTDRVIVDGKKTFVDPLAAPAGYVHVDGLADPFRARRPWVTSG